MHSPMLPTSNYSIWIDSGSLFELHIFVHKIQTCYYSIGHRWVNWKCWKLNFEGTSAFFSMFSIGNTVGARTRFIRNSLCSASTNGIQYMDGSSMQQVAIIWRWIVKMFAGAWMHIPYTLMLLLTSFSFPATHNHTYTLHTRFAHVNWTNEWVGCNKWIVFTWWWQYGFVNRNEFNFQSSHPREIFGIHCIMTGIRCRVEKHEWNALTHLIFKCNILSTVHFYSIGERNKCDGSSSTYIVHIAM